MTTQFIIWKYIHHQVGEKNWVDLNNIQTLYLNNLDCYLTYDNNTPAYGIRDETDVLVMFRQKPTSNTLLPMNVGTLPGQNPISKYYTRNIILVYYKDVELD